MSRQNIALMPMETEVIYYKGELVKFDHVIFPNDNLACCENNHLVVHNHMQDYLKTVPFQCHIDLFVTQINGLALGAINGFIDFVHERTHEISKAPHMSLLVWEIDLGYRNSLPYAKYQHTYTADNSSGIYYGKTISKVDYSVIHLVEDMMDLGVH